MKLLECEKGELATKLEKYLDADPTYRQVFDYTKKRFEERGDLTAHNWAHAYRDTLNAIVIGEAEQADMSIVLPAITMHDIGFLYGATGKTHGAVGADKLHSFLKEGDINYSDESIQHMADCIRTHKGSMHDEQPESLEAKVVADADLIEKFGPIGVYQTIRTFTEFNYSLETLLERISVFDSLTLETNTGRAIAERGKAFVIDFIEALSDSNQPYEES